MHGCLPAVTFPVFMLTAMMTLYTSVLFPQGLLATSPPGQGEQRWGAGLGRPWTWGPAAGKQVSFIPGLRSVYRKGKWPGGALIGAYLVLHSLPNCRMCRGGGAFCRKLCQCSVCGRPGIELRHSLQTRTGRGQGGPLRNGALHLAPSSGSCLVMEAVPSAAGPSSTWTLTL